MKGLIDLHTHILPFLDDGATDEEITMKMARQWEAGGVDRVVATPHGFTQLYHTDPKVILESIEKWNRRFIEEGINLQLLPGMEVRFHRELINHLRNGGALCYGAKRTGDRFLLLEFSTREWPMNR